MAPSRQAAPAVRPELVFAFVRPTGCRSEDVSAALSAELSRVGYVVGGTVKMSGILHGLRGLKDGKDVPEGALKEDDRIEKHMDAGDALRDQLENCGALANLAACEIATRRPSEDADRAWIIDSLKHKDEVTVLRRLYGSQLLVISIYDEEEDRVASLTRRIAQSWKSRKGAEQRARALIGRDLAGSDTIPNGQDVRDTFP